jgi:hypothetical protein
MIDPAIAPTLRRVEPLPEDLPGGDYEYRMMVLPRLIGRVQTQRLLTELAEQEHWELARVRMSWGGVRRVWVRRRIIRVVRTA